ncbi:MAG: hypothetical protein KGH75_05850 [Rhodospirillales bacterium]|nr:hypothetical protein [Rhodospirillales bacterium]
MFADLIEPFNKTEIEVDTGSVILTQTDTNGESMCIVIPEWAWEHFVSRVNRQVARSRGTGSADGR